MPPVEKTAFYEEVAKKGRKYWDHEKILPAKHELMELYRAPENKMIGDQQVKFAHYHWQVGGALHDSPVYVRRYTHVQYRCIVCECIASPLNAPLARE